MDGKNNDFERPALIIRKFNRQIVWVLPTTLQAKDERFHEKFALEDKEYFVAITQMRTVSTKRFLRKIGMMSKEDFKKQEITLNFIKSSSFEYNQFGNEFIPWLSIIDILMFNNVHDVKQILNQYELI